MTDGTLPTKLIDIRLIQLKGGRFSDQRTFQAVPKAATEHKVLQLKEIGDVRQTANFGYSNQTAIILTPGVLAPNNSYPEFTLMHELLHAFTGYSDEGIFDINYFTQHGLWSNGKGSQTITSWLSTDCTCTPENPQAQGCTANTAKWCRKTI